MPDVFKDPRSSQTWNPESEDAWLTDGGTRPKQRYITYYTPSAFSETNVVDIATFETVEAF